MSTKKKNSNGAFTAPVTTVFDGIEVPADVETAPPKKSNGKLKKATATDLSEDELDQKELLRVLSEVRSGNFSARMSMDRLGVSGKICDTLNEIISLNEILVQELNLARNTIGKQGRMNHRVELPRFAKGS